tara:strand:- start:296 stop:793 length:498 start_codon:yes stop_codon:yes gene_type:complete
MKTFSYLILGISILGAASAFAAPPAPALPTGACAGILKQSSLQTFTAAETEALAGYYMGTPVVAMFFDFDNSIAYISGTGETAAEWSGDDDDDRSIVKTSTIDDGAVITASVSETYTYGIEVSVAFTDNDGEADNFNLLLIPSNGGTTFFVQGLDNTFSGVCQQI